MKFDLVIGNPPYKKTLHLKILEETMNHVDFDNGGEIVWLHPANWLASITSNKDKYSWLDYMINDIETFSSDPFNIRIPGGLEIMAVKSNGKSVKDINPLKIRGLVSPDALLDIYEKIQKTNIKSFNDYIKYPNTKMQNFCVYVCLMVGTDKIGIPLYDWALNGTGRYHNGIYQNDVFEDGHTFLQRCKNQYKKDSCTRIEFNTECEARNFLKTLDCTFYRFLNFVTMVDVNVHPKQLPWMGDSINPRTGKRGYESEWTDTDFYEFFNITSDEQKLIEETIKAKA